MATRKISDIIEDLRDSVKDDSLDVSAIREKTQERASELEAILKKEKSDERFFSVLLILVSLFVIAFAVITYLNNDDLRDDVTQKKGIISKFENAIKHDTIHVYYDQDGKEITIQSLLDDNMRLMNRVSAQESYLRSIKAAYGIDIVKNKDGYYIEADKVDSAMILLPVFRDRLSYDSVKKQWIVTRRVVQVGDKTYPE